MRSNFSNGGPYRVFCALFRDFRRIRSQALKNQGLMGLTESHLAYTRRPLKLTFGNFSQIFEWAL